MPLRVTVELIPRGIEADKTTVAVVDISNDGTGTYEVGNYNVRAEGETIGGWDLFYSGKVSGVKRQGPCGRMDYLNQAIDCLRVLHTSNGEITCER